MTWSLVLIALLILVLLVISGFFSGSETALTAASRARMHQLERSGVREASVVNRLIATRERLIGGILLGNNLVNILASALATSLFITLFGEAGVVLATIVMTALVVVFAEVLPKTYAILNPDKMSLIVARPLSVIVAIFAPITATVEVIVKRVLRALGAFDNDDDDMVNAHEELRGAIDLHHKEGTVVKSDRDMLGGILDLKVLEVSDIMIHRTKIESINADETPDNIVKAVVSSAYTRIPLWREEPENIVGILHAKDLVRALQKAGGSVDGLDIKSLSRKPWFVPDTTTVQDQLRNFLRKKTHFAMVVDEYGEVQGLVTLEDIIEEIVGDISDEHDRAVSGVKALPGGTVKVEGSVPIRDLNRAMDWELPDDEATTVAGLVIHEARQIPAQGQAFLFHGFRFEVTGKTRNRIDTLVITPLAAKPARAAGETLSKREPDRATKQNA
ncbi:MAG: HlyC/CorC family transporter [Pseudomonadota bacterium]